MRDRILITDADHDRLSRLIAGRRRSGADAENLRQLEQELERADIIDDPQTVPPDVVTMNSAVNVLDLDSGEIRVYELVFPSDIRSGNGISVLAPIGTALLGYRTGSVIEWRVPRGIRRLKILDVLYQPEAAAVQNGGVSVA